MKLSEIRKAIQGSTPSDWHEIPCWGSGSGPSYKMEWDKMTGRDEWQLYFKEHSHVAVLEDEVSLTIAWGMPVDDDDREMKPPWIEKFPLVDSVSYYWIDVFWNNALIERIGYAVVDARAYVPLPMPFYESDDDSGSAALDRYEVTRFDVHLTRLAHVLGNHRPDDFEQTLERTGFDVVEGLSD